MWVYLYVWVCINCVCVVCVCCCALCCYLPMHSYPHTYPPTTTHPLPPPHTPFHPHTLASGIHTHTHPHTHTGRRVLRSARRLQKQHTSTVNVYLKRRGLVIGHGGMLLQMYGWCLLCMVGGVCVCCCTWCDGVCRWKLHYWWLQGDPPPPTPTHPHQQAGAVQTRAAYQTRWLALVSAPPPQLTMQDIPWLVAEGGPSGGAPGQVGGPHGLRAVVLHGVPAGMQGLMGEWIVEVNTKVNTLVNTHYLFMWSPHNPTMWCTTQHTTMQYISNNTVHIPPTTQMIMWHKSVVSGKNCYAGTLINLQPVFHHDCPLQSLMSSCSGSNIQVNC